jgi:membrane fusion protein, copper/silver efflux system
MSITEMMPTPGNTPTLDPPRPRNMLTWRSLALGLRIVLVRLRLVGVLVGILFVVGFWPTLRVYWDKFTRGSTTADASISPDTDYWCPMCPGVLSDWPGKCPVCNMALVRHKKHEAVPLPDGVLARMQLSPYRVQLAGIQTYPVEYRRLEQEVVLAGLVEPAPERTGSRPCVLLQADVFEKDLGLVSAGRPVEAVSEAFPTRTFPGKVARLADQLTVGTSRLHVWLEIKDPRHELRPGMFCTARLRVAAADMDSSQRAWADEWRNATMVDVLAHELFAQGRLAEAGPGPLLLLGLRRPLLLQGMVPAVPESAVVDTGARKVVFVERMPGMFDAVAVVLGRRCGEFYPLLGGLEAGDRVVSTGAFLLDATTRLDPSVAASYFGAGRPSSVATTPSPQAPDRLSAEDLALLARQKVCPVTGEPLDSMGGPVKVVVAGKTVFVCCEGCEPKLRKNPEKFLPKLGPP